MFSNTIKAYKPRGQPARLAPSFAFLMVLEAILESFGHERERFFQIGGEGKLASYIELPCF